MTEATPRATPQSSRFLAACSRLDPKPLGGPPVWFMRQAGRYLPEYRELRSGHSMLEMCKTPELACEVTLQPLRRFDFDAAILFSDILMPLEPMGVPFDFFSGEGPVILDPVRTPDAVQALKDVDPEESLGFTMEAIRLIQADLAGRVPLIGFCGAPFTLACYMIEGRGSKSFLQAKRMMYGEPETWHVLMDRLSAVLGRYLRAQAAAGVDALQVFDSWAGLLAPEDFREFVLPYSRRVVHEASRANVPVIYFGTGTAGILEWMREAGSDVVGVDWRIDLDVAWDRLGSSVGVQGNLDPTVLFGSRDFIRTRVEDVLRRANGRPGHIFNLGHGILPETPIESVDTVIETVRAWKP